MMADTVPETSCSAGSETACIDWKRVGTFATTSESIENNPAQEITFMCSDTVARSSGHHRCKSRAHHLHDVGEHSNSKQCTVADGIARSKSASKFITDRTGKW